MHFLSDSSSSLLQIPLSSTSSSLIRPQCELIWSLHSLNESMNILDLNESSRSSSFLLAFDLNIDPVVMELFAKQYDPYTKE